MNLEALGNLGDFLGGLAVIVTLLYLAAQIRQNTTALKTAGWQSVVAGARDAARLRTDPGTVRSWSKGLSSYPNLPFEEINLFNRVIVEEALHFQAVFALYQAGQLEQSPYDAYLNWFASIVSTPGGRYWWEESARPIFESAMMAAVDDRIAAGGLPDIRELSGLTLYDSPA